MMESGVIYGANVGIVNGDNGTLTLLSPEHSRSNMWIYKYT